MKRTTVQLTENQLSAILDWYKSAHHFHRHHCKVRICHGARNTIKTALNTLRSKHRKEKRKSEEE